MKLLRLHLQGFKSFRDKTTIYFDKGITGIVGPNGCGKSNIVDALFWVMGEQSAKHLRGKSMMDLIFAGSDKYSPASFAEVTLVLGNDDGKHIHIGAQVVKPTEIQLTRKLYRNGETEYRINGVAARLKDIQEVFMDTGAGAKSYSIIAQGEINRLVQAKPVERRSMIEEVAGITKFKKRKIESLRKIEQTQSNLARLGDLQSEIYKNLKSLEKQAEKAERAKTLKEKIERYELIVESHKEFELLTDFNEGIESSARNALALSNFIAERDRLELNIQEERTTKLELSEKLDEAQKEYNQLSRELASKEEKIKYFKRSLDEKEKFIDNKKVEIENLQDEVTHLYKKKNNLAEQLESLQDENTDAAAIDVLSHAISEQKVQINKKESELLMLKKELEAIKEVYNQTEKEFFKSTSRLEEYAKNLEDIAKEIEMLEEQSSQFSGELSRQKDAFEKVKKIYEETQTELTQAKQASETLNAQEKELEQKFRILSREVMNVDSKRQGLIEINKNVESIKTEAINYLEHNQETAAFLSNIVSSEEKYALAIDAMLSTTIHSLVTNDKGASLKTWLANKSDISLDIFKADRGDKISQESIERLQLKGCGELINFKNIIEIKDSAYVDLRESLDGYFVATNLTAELALDLATDLNFKGLVSLDGRIVLRKTSSGHQLSLRKTEDLSQSVILRNSEIAQLKVVLDQKNEELQKVQTELDEIIENAKLATQKYQQNKEKFELIQTDYLSKKTVFESKEMGFSTAHGRLEILKNRKKEISILRLELLEAEEKSKKSYQDDGQKIATLTLAIQAAEANIAELRAKYETDRESYVSQEVKLKTFASRLSSLNEQMNNNDDQIEKNKNRLVNNQTQIEAEEELLADARATIEIDQKAKEALIDTLKEKEEELSNAKETLEELLAQMQEREDQIKDLNSRIHKIEKQMNETEVKLAQILVEEEMIVKNTFEIYQIDLREVIASHLSLSTDILSKLNNIQSLFTMESAEGPIAIEKKGYHFNRKYGQELRDYKDKLKESRTELNRLGEINWQAITDYEHQKLRYDFLQVQEVELKKSLADLQLAISSIDEKSKVRFKEAFNEVNEKFEKVFPVIFGGGNARLEVAGHLDDPECGVDIIAQPPGKKMQNINLMSGGEKAMTAVSLIFSIFLVKPSPFCLLDEVDAPLDDANVGRFSELLREMSTESQFILITHNKKTMELNNTLYGVTMQEPGISKAVSVQLN